MTRRSIASVFCALSLILTALCVPALAGQFTTIDVPGAPDTFLLGINPQGDIVGWYYDAGFKAHGLLISNGMLSTIDVPGSTSTNLHGINARGDIVGGYTDTSGNSFGFLLSHGAFTTIDVRGSFN